MSKELNNRPYSAYVVSISVGFAAVIFLMFAMFVMTHDRVKRIQALVGEISENHSHNAQQVHRMYHAARERSYVLVELVHEPDMLEVDAYAMRFWELAHEVAQARRALDTRTLLPDERDQLERLARAIEQTVPLQEKIIELTFANQRKLAMDLLTERALPAQEEVLEALTQLVTMQHVKIGSTSEHAVEDLEAAGERLLLVTLLAVLISISIAYYVQGNTSRLMRGLSSKTEELRRSLHDLDFQKKALDEHAIVSIADRQGRITYVNDHFCKVSQYAREELIGKDHRIVNSQQHPKEFFVEMWRTVAAGKMWQGNVCNRSKDGSLYWVSTTILPFLDEQGRPEWYVSVRTEITAIKAAEEMLASNQERLERLVAERTAQLAQREAAFQLLAETDTLTGIANRRKFDETLLVEVSRAQRYGLPLTLVMLDIDHFKKLNDTFGHQAGDGVLDEFARLVSENIRAHDFFARWGGEEFTILATMSDADDTLQFAEKLRTLIASHVFPVVGQITASLGLATCRSGETTDDVLSRADKALYAAKTNGRNRVEVG